jgi:hypothetical protein
MLKLKVKFKPQKGREIETGTKQFRDKEKKNKKRKFKN